MATDPPYYDNVGYADLADFFYVAPAFARQSLSRPPRHDAYPKIRRACGRSFRHHGKQNAEKFFESGFSNVFKRIRDVSSMEYPMSIFYAYKQSEIDSAGTQTYTGWDTLLEGITISGWAITATSSANRNA